MFDIIGKVVSVESRTNASGRFSWTEIVIRESSAEESLPSATETNDIPIRFPKDFNQTGIEKNAWVKARFSLVSRIYQRSGRDERFLDAKGVAIKLLYAAKVEEKKNTSTSEDIDDMPF